jgi:hypothetical protein
MLVDMNTVTQCIVVSSPFSSARLPIKSLHRNAESWLVESQRLSASGELGRSAAWGRQRVCPSD